MTTLFLFLWLIPIAVNVYIDRDGKKPNYMIVFLVRTIAAILHAILMDAFCDIFPDNLHLYSGWQLFLIWLPVLSFQVTSYWIVFEMTLNLVRGRELFYYDRKERDSGWVDKIFDVLGNGPHLAAKILAMIVCVLAINAILHT